MYSCQHLSFCLSTKNLKVIFPYLISEILNKSHFLSFNRKKSVKVDSYATMVDVPQYHILKRRKPGLRASGIQMSRYINYHKIIIKHTLLEVS